MIDQRNRGFLTGNQLKLIAMLTMTCDHVGMQLLPRLTILRIIGRLAFPIFAYMIAEGCRYTRSRKRYLLSVLTLALLCQAVYFVALRSLYQCILVTFSLSIGMILLLDRAKERRSLGAWALAVAYGLAVVFAAVWLERLVPMEFGYGIDYGIWGIALPVWLYFAPRRLRIPILALALAPLCLTYGGIQWYCYLAVPLLACYNGRRGKRPMKNLFYIYYPAHLAAIWLISVVF